MFEAKDTQINKISKLMNMQTSIFNIKAFSSVYLIEAKYFNIVKMYMIIGIGSANDHSNLALRI
jgi:hypothetical protein